jgi:hypothetical protein
MSDLDHIGRRPVLAGIGAAALVGFFDPTLVRAQAQWAACASSRRLPLAPHVWLREGLGLLVNRACAGRLPATFAHAEPRI